LRHFSGNCSFVSLRLASGLGASTGQTLAHCFCVTYPQPLAKLQDFLTSKLIQYGFLSFPANKI